MIHLSNLCPSYSSEIGFPRAKNNNTVGPIKIIKMGQKVGKLLPVSFFFLLSLAAQVSKKERQAWFKMVKDYFFHSNNLRRVFLLIDIVVR